jgi:hypothetical protein
VRARAGADRECTILARLQAVYFGETGLRSRLDGPGLTEICFESDCARIRRELTATPSRHLFVDHPTIQLLGLSSVLENYRLVDSSADGELMHYEPLSAAPR